MADAEQQHAAAGGDGASPPPFVAAAAVPRRLVAAPPRVTVSQLLDVSQAGSDEEDEEVDGGGGGADAAALVGAALGDAGLGGSGGGGGGGGGGGDGDDDAAHGDAHSHASDDVAPLTSDVKDAFGKQRLNMLASIVLNLNNNMGAALVLMPLLNQLAGWLTPLIAISLAFVISSFAATMLCEAMQRIPGNRNFTKRYEFVTCVRHYYGKRWYIAAQILFNLALQTSNIAAMIVAAQNMDGFLIQIFKRSYALDYGIWPPRFIQSVNLTEVPTADSLHPWLLNVSVTNSSLPVDAPHRSSFQFVEQTWILSIGFIVTMAICIPFGYLNLDENMGFQYFSVLGLLILTFEFYVQMIMNIVPSSPFYVGQNVTTGRPANGVGLTPVFAPAGQVQVLGIAVFAFAYVVTVPSWANEKARGVSINAAIWSSASIGWAMKVAVGFLGSWAYVMTRNGVPFNGTDNVLNLLALKTQWVGTIYASFLWSITTLIPGIPVLAIMVRYNLLSGKVCGPRLSFFFGVVAPWIVTAFLYENQVLAQFTNWCSIIIQGFVNFVVPVLLYRESLRRYPRAYGDEEYAVEGGGGGDDETDDDVLSLTGRARVRRKRRNLNVNVDEERALLLGADEDSADEDEPSVFRSDAALATSSSSGSKVSLSSRASSSSSSSASPAAPANDDVYEVERWFGADAAASAAQSGGDAKASVGGSQEALYRHADWEAPLPSAIEGDTASPLVAGEAKRLSGEAGGENEELDDGPLEPPVNALPRWMLLRVGRVRLTRTGIALFIAIFFSILTVLTIGLNIFSPIYCKVESLQVQRGERTQSMFCAGIAVTNS